MVAKRTPESGKPNPEVDRRTVAASVALTAVLLAGVLLAPAPTAADGAGTLQPAANDSPDGATALVAPGALASHSDPSALLQEATESATVARGDIAVARFAVSDLDDHYGERDRRDELDAGNLSLTVAPADSNRSNGAGAWHSDATNVSVLPDPENGTLYAFWHVPEDAETGDYEVKLRNTSAPMDENRSASVTFTVVEREVTFPYGDEAIFQPGPTVVYGNATVAPGTSLALQARAPGESGFPVNGTVEVDANGSFRTRMDFTPTENGTRFTLSALGYPDSAVSGIIIGPGPDDLTPSTTFEQSSTTAATTSGEATTSAVATPTGTSTDGSSTTTGGQPGFGLVVGLLAVVATLALGVRRGSG